MLRPLNTRKKTAAANVINETMLNVSACRMNGMSRVKRKNSMVLPCLVCRPREGEDPASFDDAGSRLRGNDDQVFAGAPVAAFGRHTWPMEMRSSFLRLP